VFCQLLITSHRRPHHIVSQQANLSSCLEVAFPSGANLGREYTGRREAESMKSCVQTLSNDIPLRISSRVFRFIKHHEYVNFLFSTCSRLA